MDGEKERQGDYVFTANDVGEYRFCFDNSVSTFSDKIVDFEIAVSLAPLSSYSMYYQTLTSHRRSKTSLKQAFPKNPAQHPSK